MESSTKPAAPPIDRYQRQIPTSPLPSICPFPTLYSAHPSHMPPRKRHKASSTHPSNQPPSLSQPLSQPDSRPLHPQQHQQQRPGTARFSRTFNHLHSAHALTRDPASDVIGRERERGAADGRTALSAWLSGLAGHGMGMAVRIRSHALPPPAVPGLAAQPAGQLSSVGGGGRGQSVCEMCGFQCFAMSLAGWMYCCFVFALQ